MRGEVGRKVDGDPLPSARVPLLMPLLSLSVLDSNNNNNNTCTDGSGQRSVIRLTTVRVATSNEGSERDGDDRACKHTCERVSESMVAVDLWWRDRGGDEVEKRLSFRGPSK